MNRLLITLFFTLLTIVFHGYSFAQPIPKQTVQQIGKFLKDETGATFSFYLRKVNSNIEYENINDPYNTFGNSIIFAASAKEEGNIKPFGIFGVYKDGAVVWYSEPIEYPNHFTSGGISDVRELNRDGKVEIITTWKQHYDGIFGPKYGWIFSWDGSTGSQINEVDEKGYSTLISHETGDFSMTDLNGDGILEIYSSTPETDIPIQSYQYHYYKWNGTIYEKLLTAPSEEELKFVPKDRFEANILFSIEKSDDYYNYNYQVFNQAISIQEINRIYMNGVPKNIINERSNTDWNFSKARRTPFITWVTRGEVPKNIIPGDTSIVLSYSSVGIPSIIKYYLLGKNRSPLLSEISLEERIENIYSNSVSAFTLGPWLPDSSMSLDSFTDTLETFRFRSCEELGWANNTNVCAQLEDDLSQVKSSLVAQDSIAAANALSDFIELVEQEKDASLTSEGYALLYFNAEYLAERLPMPVDEPEGSGITCECANLVTQTSGQIRFTGGETRCLAGEFSGSVFFQQSGKLEVCGNATFQNISGNNTGTVAVSETGVVSIQNWNNNNTADSLINWGSMEFRNQVNVNQGQLINHGQLTVKGGLNQNNGSLSNSGTLTVNRAMNLNQPGTMNTGILSVGQRLTLNSNASLINECRVSVNGPIQLNGTISMEAGSFLQSGGRVTINSQGVLALNGENTMAWLDALRLNGAIESNGDNQLLYSESNIQTNNSAQINSQGELLQVSAPNLSGLIANYPIADGTNAVIPTSSCNPIGFNNE